MIPPAIPWISAGTLGLALGLGIRIQKYRDIALKTRTDLKNIADMVRTQAKTADRRHLYYVIAYLRTTKQSEERDREIERMLLEGDKLK
jgi:hypothetical protein